jgi:hypothetical protein
VALVAVLLTGVGIGYKLRGLTVEETPMAEAPPTSSAVPVREPEPASPRDEVATSLRQRAPKAGAVSLATPLLDAGMALAAAAPAVDAGAKEAATRVEHKSYQGHPYVVREDGSWVHFDGDIPAALQTGTLHGIATFDGIPNPLPPVPRANFSCPSQPAPDPSLVVGRVPGQPDQRLANVVVEVLTSTFDRSSRAGTQSPPEAAEQAFDGCVLDPHIRLQKGPVLLTNRDRIAHVLRVFGDGRLPIFQADLARWATRTVDPRWLKVTLDPDLPILSEDCSLHPWEHAYMVVARSSFAAVTGPDGTYSFTGLMPGYTYTVLAWHERYGFQRHDARVDVATPAVNFAFGPAGQVSAR